MLGHVADHAGEVVEHATVVVAVEGGHEGGEATLIGGVVGQTADQGGEDAVGCRGSLFFGGSDLLAELVEHVVGELVLEQVHQIHSGKIVG